MHSKIFRGYILSLSGLRPPQHHDRAERLLL
jgi:hypothetical protein